MIVAGLQKLSLVDFPGKLAAVIFLQGCNFKCGYCHNPALVALEGPEALGQEEVLDYLKSRKDKLEGVVITGGEPTIHGDLAGFIKRISGIGLKVKLDTNGSNPKFLKEIISEGLLDYVAVDIKTSFRKYHLVSKSETAAACVAETVEICLSSNIPYELRTTCVPGIVEEDDLHDIGRAVRGAKLYCLQQFRPGITLGEEFSGIKPFNKARIKAFSDIMAKYVDRVEVRGV